LVKEKKSKRGVRHQKKAKIDGKMRGKRGGCKKGEREDEKKQ